MEGGLPLSIEGREKKESLKKPPCLEGESHKKKKEEKTGDNCQLTLF